MLNLDTFLTMERVRDSLDVPTGVTEDDSLLQELREAATSWASEYTGIPILDRNEAVFFADTPKGQDRLIVTRPVVQALTAIRYWDSAGESDAPDGSLTGNALPRFAALGNGAGITIFPPSGGWPEMDARAGLWAVMRCGLPSEDQRKGAFRQGAIEYIRNRRYAFRGVKENDAMIALLRPVMDKSAGMAQRYGGWDKWVPDDGTGEALTYGGEAVTFGGVRVRY